MINSNLIINQKNWHHIMLLYKNNKIPNAFLFDGPSGSGKEGHAIELAGLINCVSPNKSGACGNCNSCKKTKLFQHENIQLILPMPRGKIKSSDDPLTKAFTEPILKEYYEK